MRNASGDVKRSIVCCYLRLVIMVRLDDKISSRLVITGRLRCATHVLKRILSGLSEKALIHCHAYPWESGFGIRIHTTDEAATPDRVFVQRNGFCVNKAVYHGA